MACLNPNLTALDFYKTDIVRTDDQKGFKAAPRVVTIRGPFKLFKLTFNDAPEHPTFGTVSPWWSAAEPFQEDYEGALGRFKQAYMNGIDMSSMVRYMSAVKAEWNSLNYYVEISIKRGDEVKCFWGEFAPMPLSSNIPQNASNIAEFSSTSSASSQLGYLNAFLPDSAFHETHIGVLSAWQFFIPNLSNAFIEGGIARTQVDAHDMVALGRHFGLDLGKTSHLGKVSNRLRFFYRDTRKMAPFTPRHPILKKMDACFNQLWNLDISPQKSLEQFINYGESYIANHLNDPVSIKNMVQHYLDEAKKPI
ncbi:hypothetical protein ThidrDRAFT_2289 [Thiorhodococcus drewsii AZ1]|uniref:Uncharacterized protein n=1 Tax=Thiorhodococcus drewsii AZ1 TaxID=765913 RepID=G2E1X6_9GAMM|nr:hypothetical protein [Thiorhodococcus drewsii]EGV31184.1 hypothetical protein ThidrDRAFT_2289 [Thiorhodococcus drewsii AZ1]